MTIRQMFLQSVFFSVCFIILKGEAIDCTTLFCIFHCTDCSSACIENAENISNCTTAGIRHQVSLSLCAYSTEWSQGTATVSPGECVHQYPPALVKPKLCHTLLTEAVYTSLHMADSSFGNIKAKKMGC